MNLIFDSETNGLLQDVTKVHCIGMAPVGTHSGQLFANAEGYDSLEECLTYMTEAESLIGHNIIGYDLPVLKKVLGWTPRPKTKIIDTLVYSRLIHTNLKERDFQSKKLEPKLCGSHSLKAWGYRLGMSKGNYHEQTDWQKFTKDMADYCMVDVSITSMLFEHLELEEYSQEALDLEMPFAKVIQRQEDYGFNFDVKKGQELYVSLLKRKDELNKTLRDSFGSWFESAGSFTPKRDNTKRGYTAGQSFTKIKLTEFNPNSRDHISNRLQSLYGWSPKDFTPNGRPKIDESILRNLMLPNCKELEEHFLVSKRISQLAEGDNAWLKLERNGRIHGRVNTNGAVTGRCTHSYPNVAQVPASYSKYGPECRSLFRAGENNVLVGCDADGLELRCLAGYLKKYDGGVYAEAAVNGTKEQGTDIHSLNRDALGITSRDTAKTFFYAFIYGAGDTKLGNILGGGTKRGRKARNKFLSGVSGLMELTSRVKQVYRRRGHLIGLDGRKLHVRSEHSALNTLLQSAGAVLMKKALVLLDERLILLGLEPVVDYEFVANIHDEFQIETKEKYVRYVGPQAALSLERAGEYFEFGCKITGSYQTGSNWSATH